MIDFLAIICVILGVVSISLIAYCCLSFANALLDLLLWWGWRLIWAIYILPCVSRNDSKKG